MYEVQGRWEDREGSPEHIQGGIVIQFQQRGKKPENPQRNRPGRSDTGTKKPRPKKTTWEDPMQDRPGDPVLQGEQPRQQGQRRYSITTWPGKPRESGLGVQETVWEATYLNRHRKKRRTSQKMQFRQDKRMCCRARLGTTR